MTRLVLLLVVVLAACSPEATRSRGGGAGADVGNHGSPFEMHGQTNTAHAVPRIGRAATR